MEINQQQLRAIAIYLPQFHPIPENDRWWGKGFTEWTNVTRAKPLYKGHYQPHLPADLGFYDLRVAETREAQAALAKEYGIYGFCYYHYWFNGKRLLERPFEEVFESGRPDFPFMLCWANENWTRAWDGDTRDILLEQKYSEEDDRRHIKTLIPYFKDSRYIRINNKPVISIYRSTLLPDAAATIRIWREEAAKHDIELYICRFESCHIGGEEYLDPGFDAAIDLQPWSRTMKKYREILNDEMLDSLNFRIKKFIYKKWIRRIAESAYKQYKKKLHDQLYNNYVLDYADYVDFIVNTPVADYKVYPGITPGWDNSPRRKQNPGIMLNASPEHYKKWLQHLVTSFEPFSDEENFIFINAWNEWAEGNHLEPCQRWGRRYLEVTREVLSAVPETRYV